MVAIRFAKTQIACLVILLYIAWNYFYECRKYGRKLSDSYYDEILFMSIFTVIFDGITACTVNFPDAIPRGWNLTFHAFFFLGLDAMTFFVFRYLRWTVRKPKKRGWAECIVFLPWIANLIVFITNMDYLQFVKGEITNFSVGISATTCFVTAFIYIAACIVEFLRGWSHIGMGKRIAIVTYLAVIIVVCAIQAIFPEVLLTSLGITIITIGIYLNQENPAFDELRRDHNTMILGFADLVENRDENTGGHIKRTSAYVELVVRKLRKMKKYSDIITDDYAEDLIKAAPLHDIGKISTPDAILTKPGKLTDEEYDIMKQHAAKGEEIIDKLLRDMSDEDYKIIAHDVAGKHHEKWNGKGYPNGIAGEDIPLCARIMAVADVFDAISQKRCYRDAMPLDKCFAIIEEGSGTDFDPDIVAVFLDLREEASKICNEFRDM